MVMINFYFERTQFINDLDIDLNLRLKIIRN